MNNWILHNQNPPVRTDTTIATCDKILNIQEMFPHAKGKGLAERQVTIKNLWNLVSETTKKLEDKPELFLKALAI